jgi:hypothetical protein
MVDDIKRADPTDEIDVSGFAPVLRKPLPSAAGRSLAEVEGFASREYKRPRRRRTGLSAQLGLKDAGGGGAVHRPGRCGADGLRRIPGTRDRGLCLRRCCRQKQGVTTIAWLHIAASERLEDRR